MFLNIPSLIAKATISRDVNFNQVSGPYTTIIASAYSVSKTDWDIHRYVRWVQDNVVKRLKN
jgi:hypothetical protein